MCLKMYKMLKVTALECIYSENREKTKRKKNQKLLDISKYKATDTNTKDINIDQREFPRDFPDLDHSRPNRLPHHRLHRPQGLQTHPGNIPNSQKDGKKEEEKTEKERLFQQQV